MSRGSILVEQVIALALMSIMLVSIFSLLTAGSLAAQVSQEFSLASGLAAQKLEQIMGSREDPTEVERQPLDPERYPKHYWQVDVSEVDATLHQVTVTVWWPFRGRERATSLTTLVRSRDE